jgi:hypothetical protein
VYLDYSLEDLDRETGTGERLWQERSPEPSGR